MKWWLVTLTISSLWKPVEFTFHHQDYCSILLFISLWPNLNRTHTIQCSKNCTLSLQVQLRKRQCWVNGRLHSPDFVWHCRFVTDHVRDGKMTCGSVTVDEAYETRSCSGCRDEEKLLQSAEPDQSSVYWNLGVSETERSSSVVASQMCFQTTNHVSNHGQKQWRTLQKLVGAFFKIVYPTTWAKGRHFFGR